MPFTENSKVIIKKGLAPGIITECVGPKRWKVTLVDETGKKKKETAMEYTSQKLRHPKHKEWPSDQRNTLESGQRARGILKMLSPKKLRRQQPHSAAESLAKSSEEEDVVIQMTSDKIEVTPNQSSEDEDEDVVIHMASHEIEVTTPNHTRRTLNQHNVTENESDY